MSENSRDKNNLVSAKEYAEKYRDTEENIIQMIRDGALVGEVKDNIWYVDLALSDGIDTRGKNNVAGSNLQSEGVDPKLAGIGGWLILPAIGFVLGPIIGVIMLIPAFQMYSEVARAGYGGIYALELVVGLGLLAFVIYAAALFFQKKEKAPRVIIGLIIVSLVASGALLVIELGAGAEVFARETIKQLIRDIIGAAIWIPYFRVSKRVKATFVH